jgi:sulfur-carrier protein
MPVKVHIPTAMRQHADGQAVVEVSAASVKEALDSLSAKHPGITARLFENGQVRRFVNIYLNDEDIRYLKQLDTPLKQGDVVSILPALAGG